MGVKAGTGRFIARGVYLAEWKDLNSGASVGSWIQLGQLPDRTVTVSGTFLSGTNTVRIEGTNTPVSGLTSAISGAVLSDSRGAANPLSISISTATVFARAILENTWSVRPVITTLASTSTHKFTVRILASEKLR